MKAIINRLGSFWPFGKKEEKPRILATSGRELSAEEINDLMQNIVKFPANALLNMFTHELDVNLNMTLRAAEVVIKNKKKLPTGLIKEIKREFSNYNMKEEEWRD